MKKIKIGLIMMQIGTVFYLIENFYFGWNKLPMSDMELYADNIVRFFIYGGAIIYFLPLWKLYENAVQEYDWRRENPIKY